MNAIDSIKRVVVTLVTELFFFVIGMSMIYLLYIKNCTMPDIRDLMILIIMGIGTMGGGYIGIKMWENIKSTNGGTNGQTQKTA